MVEELVRNGVDYFCISPGSRSSPLSMAVGFNVKASSHVHFDERGTAFHALGYVAATKKPCVLISTSGTAVANMLPAVIEASKKKIPLIILTADRPPEERMTGANQVIDQVKIFGEYVRWHFDIPCPTEEIKPEFILTTINQAIFRARSNPPGPVHLNCMFREPLAPTKSNLNLEHYIRSIKRWLDDDKVYTQYVAPEPTIATNDIEPIVEKINAIKSGIIVVGKLGTQQDREGALKLAQALNWPIFPDISSGLRLGENNKNIISYFDQILLSDHFAKHSTVDGVIHLGGRITSKRWYEYIDHHRPKEYLMVLNHPLRNDPTHIVTTRLQTKVNLFCEAIVEKLSQRKENTFLSHLQNANKVVEETINNFLETSSELFETPHELSEPEVARLISQLIPKNTGLFLASSLPVREMDMYADFKGNAIEIGANRGASGIDGTIASVCGFTVGLNKSVTLLIGDLAFLYDLNSLAMVKDLKKPLVIVVINNNGGGIFSFLPIAHSNKLFEKFFGTPHNLSFESAAKLFNLNYAQPKTKTEFKNFYQKAVSGKTSTIIEVIANREQNVAIHHDLQKKIAVALSEKFK